MATKRKSSARYRGKHEIWNTSCSKSTNLLINCEESIWTTTAVLITLPSFTFLSKRTHKRADPCSLYRWFSSIICLKLRNFYFFFKKTRKKSRKCRRTIRSFCFEEMIENKALDRPPALLKQLVTEISSSEQNALNQSCQLESLTTAKVKWNAVRNTVWKMWSNPNWSQRCCSPSHFWRIIISFHCLTVYETVSLHVVESNTNKRSASIWFHSLLLFPNCQRESWKVFFSTSR